MRATTRLPPTTPLRPCGRRERAAASSSDAEGAADARPLAARRGACRLCPGGVRKGRAA